MTLFKNEQEVYSLYKKSGRKIIIFEGSVYDVDNYIQQHPGGVDKIEEYLGRTIDEAFEEAEHTKAARLIFRDLEKIGVIEGGPSNKIGVKGLDGFELTSRFTLDYTKGAYWQLLNSDLTYDEYITFINEPKHLVNPIRDLILFDTPILEILTKTPWYGVPIGYIPLLYFHFSNAFH